MISQRCPKCGSSRIRRGYRPTTIFSKLFCRYNLLCDGCNWEFKGFAVPGTVSWKPKRKQKNSVERNNRNNSVRDNFNNDKTDSTNKRDSYKKSKEHALTHSSGK